MKVLILQASQRLLKILPWHTNKILIILLKPLKMACFRHLYTLSYPFQFLLLDCFYMAFSTDPYAGEAASLEYNIFSMIGVKIEDTMIRKITDVKYTGVSRPAVNPF